MPDPNKLKKHQEIGFAIVTCCNTCSHGQFKPGTDFGVCKKFTYEHQKHTGAPRQLSVHRAGRCSHHETDSATADELRRSGFLDP